MRLPLELFKDERGVLSESRNPTISQEKYILAIKYPEKINYKKLATLDYEFELNYKNVRTCAFLPKNKIIEYLSKVD